MKSVLAESTERHPTSGPIDAFMQFRKLSVPNGVSSYMTITELELTASHSSDPYHLAPSCPECRRLRAKLTFIAQSALAHVAATQTEIDFKIFADPGIVCSPGDARPCVTVSIYVWDRPGAANANGASAVISQIHRALAALGLRTR